MFDEYARLFAAKIGAGHTSTDAAVPVADAYLDRKPRRRGKRKTTSIDRDAVFWYSTFLRTLPAEAWHTEPLAPALARYMGQEVVSIVHRRRYRPRPVSLSMPIGTEMSKTGLRIPLIILSVAVAIALSACIGGGGSRMVVSGTRLPPDEFPALPLQQPVHAAQSPIVELQGSLHVGADVAPSAGQVAPAATHNGIAVSFGQVRDGVGGDEVSAYLNFGYDEESGASYLSRFFVRPIVRLAEGTSDEYADYAIRVVQLVNAALPRESRLLFGSDPAPPLIALEDVPTGEIFINFVPREDWNVEFSVEDEIGIAIPSPVVHSFDPDTGKPIFALGASQIWIDPSGIPRGQFERGIVAVTAHELIHAIGMLLHTDSTRFPNSIMSAGSYGSETGHLLTPTDREALLAVYSGLELQASPDQTVENLGPWDDISVHIRGSFDAPDGPVSFGVASRNGLAQPWAFGPTPSTDLADNPILSGTASWSGRLLGFTPTVEVIAGTADLAMDLGTLNGQLEFANLESWAPNAAPGQSGSGTIWGDGDLQYTVGVRGNTFVQNGGDEGTVTGAFFGSAHEAMGGVVERVDLAAGFGGSR